MKDNGNGSSMTEEQAENTSNVRAREDLTRAEREVLDVARDPILAQMLEEERVEAQAVDTALLWRLLRRIKPHIWLAVGAIGLALLEALLMTLPAWLIGLAIDGVTSGGDMRDGAVAQYLFGGVVYVEGWTSSPGAAIIAWFALMVGTVFILRWLIAATTTFMVQKLGQLVVHDLRTEVFEHITSMDLSWLQKNPVGRLVNRTTFDVQAVSDLFSNAFAQGLRDLLFIVVLVVVMLTLDPVLGSILVGAFPLLIAIALVYRRYGRPAMRTTSAVLSRMNAWLAENISGMRENHLYRRERRRRAEFKSLTDAHQASVTRAIQAWGLLRPAMMMTSAIATALVLLVGYGRVVDGLVTVGLLLTFIQYTNRLWRPVRSLTEKYNMIQTSLTSGERVLDVLDAQPAMVDSSDANPALKVEDGRIEFDEVEFAYPSKPDVQVLQGVTFSAKAGEKVALVGDTGAGKSTISHLISRFYDATAGEVRVGGRSVREYTLKNLRRGIALVPQDVVIFAGSVRENITLGIDVSDELVRECIEAVCADTFVDRLDGGLDHVLEEGGRTLSTGERQLLSFARALVVNPPILILDEATASVDTHTEMVIQDALGRLTAGRTSIVIAHRLSTVRDADQILVLRHGRIIERGTHEELLETGGEYARLYRLHMGDEPVSSPREPKAESLANRVSAAR